MNVSRLHSVARHIINGAENPCKKVRSGQDLASQTRISIKYCLPSAYGSSVQKREFKVHIAIKKLLAEEGSIFNFCKQTNVHGNLWRSMGELDLGQHDVG